MKKLICILAITTILLTGCGSETVKLEESKVDNLEKGWNGLYKSDSNYYIMLYAGDNGKMTFNVIEHSEPVSGSSMTTYPFQNDSVIIEDDNTLTYEKTSTFFGESNTSKIHVAKKDNTITITSSDTSTDGVLNEINGTFTKYKNVKSGNVEEFSELLK